MIYTRNPYEIKSGNVFYAYDIDGLKNKVAMNLGETYLVNDKGNERLGKQKLDLVVL